MKLILLLVGFVCMSNASFLNWDSLNSDELNELDVENMIFDEPRLPPKSELIDGPPPHDQYARVARYIVHKSDWTSLGTISTMEKSKGYPMVSIISIADSAKDAKSTGRVFFYLASPDVAAQDIEIDNRVTMMFTNDIDGECSKGGVDPMEPTCGRIMLTGYVERLKNGTEIYEFGHQAYRSRHPRIDVWERAHNLYLCILKIEQIMVLDYYGGPHFVSTEEYYNSNDNTLDVKENKMRYNNEHDVNIKVHSDGNHINIEIL